MEGGGGALSVGWACSALQELYAESKGLMSLLVGDFLDPHLFCFQAPEKLFPPAFFPLAELVLVGSVSSSSSGNQAGQEQNRGGGEAVYRREGATGEGEG